MEIKQPAVAGTLESSDIMITVLPNETGTVELELTSIVEKQFGTAIRQSIVETLGALGVKSVRLIAADKGALDATIRARVKTAVFRGAQENVYQWGGVRNG